MGGNRFETSDVPLFVTSKATHLAIRLNYKAILSFFTRNIMLFSSLSAIDAFAAMAERYDFLKSEGQV